MLKEIVVANKFYAAANIEKEENLDNIALNVIRQDCPAFLFPVRLMNIDDELQIRYEMMGGIKLSFIPLKMCRHDFNQLLHELLAPLADCVDWFLDYHSLYFDRKYILVDQNEYKVKYAYLFERNQAQTEQEVLDFFRDLVMETDIQDEPGYSTKLLRCIMGKDASVMSLIEMVREEMKNVPFRKIPEIAVPQKEQILLREPEMPVKQENKREPEQAIPPQADKEFGKSDMASIVGKGLFGEDAPSDKKKKSKAKEKKEKEKDAALFGKLLGRSRKKEPVQQHTANRQKEETFLAAEEKQRGTQLPMYQEPDDYSDRTEIGEEEEQEESVLRLTLTSVPAQQAPESIVLDLHKGYAVVGRVDKTGNAGADFSFPMSFTFIGRRHLRFEYENGLFFVIDLESKNHTYINGEQMLPNYRYPLKKGDFISITGKYNLTYKVG